MRYEHESRTTEMLRLIREIQDDTAKALAASEQVGATCDRYRRTLEKIRDGTVDGWAREIAIGALPVLE